MKSKGILFLSNGHGEDSINCQILKALRLSGADVDVSAIPIVGDGAAYRRSTVPIIGSTSQMPSGGVFYMNPLFFLKDLGAGLIALTWQQLQAVWRHSRHCDLVVATGDIVAAAIAPAVVHHHNRTRSHIVNHPICDIFRRECFFIILGIHIPHNQFFVHLG
ncbi:hypothetical protein NDA07_26265 [Microcoleus vaginatus DQ-U2]|uniref:hypothetical protein n=1 Tax=Microcoleus vaginatus TaxID=119532 RepID=UPI0032AB856B